MNKWQDYFEIQDALADPDSLDSIKHWDFKSRYKLIDKSTGKIIGRYQDDKYARKQAKYKFKKMAKRVERILLG